MRAEARNTIKEKIEMNKILAHRFGLTSVVLVLSLLMSTLSFGDQTADKQNAPVNAGPQQVVVTNSVLQPVPVVPVSAPSKDYYQATQTFKCTDGNSYYIPVKFVIPDNKKLVVQYVSVVADSNGGPTQSYSAQILAPGSASEFWLPLTLLAGTPNPKFAGTQSLLMVTDEVDVTVARSPYSPSCTGSITISGELIPGFIGIP
jgi:hypothetical protein